MEKSFIEAIIEQNKNIFTTAEYKVIKKHIELTRKIYLLGFMNGREIYK